ncbi:MAG: hypothetical protein ACE5EY_01365 [Anaerolineae bacterium]
MSQLSAIDILVESLTAVPEYDNPLNPIYDVLGKEQSFPERPLTLRAIRQHTELLHAHTDLARDQSLAVNKVIVSCKQISPTPLLEIPLGF